MRKLYTILLLLFIAGRSLAQTGELQGRVYDEKTNEGIPFAPVGIESGNMPDLVETIFPIPANDHVNIYFKEMRSAGEATIRLYDFVGREVSSFALSRKNPRLITVDIHQLAEGVYLLDVALPGQHCLRKFIVE